MILNVPLFSPLLILLTCSENKWVRD